MRGIRRNPESYVVERPASAFAESLRTLHTALLMSTVDDPPKTILVTSSVPREGTSTVPLSIPRLMARSGRQLLLVVGDPRRAPLNPTPGLCAGTRRERHTSVTTTRP